MFWPGIGKRSNPRLCSMTGYTTFHCIVLGSGRYTPIAMSNVDDPTRLEVKEELVALDHFISNMQGETKKHVETLMGHYDDALEWLEVKGKIEREDAMEIASLKDNLDEEHELRVSLEEQLESIEETNNSIVAKLIKDVIMLEQNIKFASKNRSSLVFVIPGSPRS